MHQRLFILRRENKLTQQEVARIIGMSEKSYRLKEKGDREFTITEGKKLARYFDCTLNDLFEDTRYITEEISYNPKEVSIEVIHHLEKIIDILKERL